VAIVSGDNPRLPRFLPVYRLLTAETSCSEVDLPFSGVPNNIHRLLLLSALVVPNSSSHPLTREYKQFVIAAEHQGSLKVEDELVAMQVIELISY
jgi:hypothetical protein